MLSVCDALLQDCGSDAHGHVPGCPDNTAGGGHFASEAQYAQMQKARRTKMLRNYLRDLSPDQRQHALEVSGPHASIAPRCGAAELRCDLTRGVCAAQDCRVELRDVGLDPRDFR